MIDRLAAWWCRTFHGDIYRPMNGQYQCKRCLRITLIQGWK